MMAKAHDGAKPSVGRIVHYYSKELAIGPFAAVITYVDGDECNLFVFPRNAGVIKEDNEVIRAEFSEEPKPGHWTWPPRV